MNMRSGNDGSRLAAEKQLNDSGFTLIELVVGITVMLFVMLSVTVFVSIGTRGYTTSNAEVSLQMESQMVLNDIEDIIMEGAGVSSKISDLDRCDVYPVMMPDGRALLIFDAEHRQLLEYRQSADEITDDNGKIKDVPSSVVQTVKNDPNEYMIAEGVTSLSIQQEDRSLPLVKVIVGFERPGKSRSVTGVYRMRNFTAPE